MPLDTPRSLLGAWMGILAGCSATPADGKVAGVDGATPSVVPVASASAGQGYGALRTARTLAKTPDGIPIMEVAAHGSQKEGDVVWLHAAYKALDPFPRYEACDGESIYLAVGEGSSLLARDGEIVEDPLAEIGVTEGGCGAARNGELLLSGVAPSDREETVEVSNGSARWTETRKAMEQVVVRVDAAGARTKIAVPRDRPTEKNCRALLGDRGSFTLILFEPVEFDGRAFTEKANGLGWYGGRTVVGKPFGPRFCFESCNGPEAAGTPPLTNRLRKALDFQSGSFPSWIAFEDRIAGSRVGRAVRATLTGDVEVVDGVPDSKMLGGSTSIVFTKAGDLVIGLDYNFKQYVVWPAGSKTLSAVRTLDAAEILAGASPTAIVRGVKSPLPPSDTFAVVLGKSIDIGTGGATYGYSHDTRGATAHKERFARAKKLISGRLVAAHDAIVDADCGTYVRSPLGWEGERIFDWVAPTLPALSPLAVTKASQCMAFAKLGALPGDPDLLFGLVGSDLYVAWLPPALPLPKGTDPRRPKQAVGPLVQNPRPGSGWSRIGHVDDFVAEPAVPDPGADAVIPVGTWQMGGAAIVTVDHAEILVTEHGAVTLPSGTRAMAVGQTGALHAWGASGSLVVECRASCRTLDPGPKGDIVAIVPRTEKEVVLGYADGRVGVYAVPDRGGVDVPAHPLTSALADAIGRRPAP